MSLFSDATPAGRFPALDNLCWQSDSLTARMSASDLLASEVHIGRHLATWVADLTPRQTREILNRSVETSTHYKWFLGEHDPYYVVWAHQYLNAKLFAASKRFAASVHNHRYPFVSRVLTGALHTSSFAVSSAASGLHVELSGKGTFNTGDVMSLSAGDVHRIDRVEDGTVTIVIRGPVTRHYSIRFDLNSGYSERIHDLDSVFPQLAPLLAQGGLVLD